MKNYFILLFVSLAVSLCSCQDEVEPGGTAVENMAGDWWVTYQSSVAEYDYLIDSIGAMPSESTIESWKWDYILSDALPTRLTTYNTASNATDSMFINDGGNYWDYKVKVGVDYANKTFKCDSVGNLSYDSGVKVIGGKILKDAATSPSGMPVDSIVFYIRFYDDENGFTYTKVSGFRRTGFGKDDF